MDDHRRVYVYKLYTAMMEWGEIKMLGSINLGINKRVFFLSPVLVDIYVFPDENSTVRNKGPVYIRLFELVFTYTRERLRTWL